MTNKDQILSSVKHYLLRGWPSKTSLELKLILQHGDELSCMRVAFGGWGWGPHIIVLFKLRQQLLNELPDAHLGIN